LVYLGISGKLFTLFLFLTSTGLQEYDIRLKGSIFVIVVLEAILERNTGTGGTVVEFSDELSTSLQLV